jgi:hypothetical protein
MRLEQLPERVEGGIQPLRFFRVAADRRAGQG